MINQENKAELERILTVRHCRGVPMCRVSISDDGRFALIQVAEKLTQRTLSNRGQEFLREGSAVLGPGESFLEPE